jgi:hypothetical protein
MIVWRVAILTACAIMFDARAMEPVWSPKIDAACPDAVQERAKLLAARRKPKDVINVSRPALKRQLLQMQANDQVARQLLLTAFSQGDIPMDDPARILVRDVDAVNLTNLKHILAQEGVPTTAMVGVDGMHAVFLLIQHADDDPRFQERMLPIFAAKVRTGEITGGQYAMLSDRVLVNHSKPQRYGTQLIGSHAAPIADPAHVDQRRHALGIISMRNYLCIASADASP